MHDETGFNLRTCKKQNTKINAIAAAPNGYRNLVSPVSSKSKGTDFRDLSVLRSRDDVFASLVSTEPPKLGEALANILPSSSQMPTAKKKPTIKLPGTNFDVGNPRAQQIHENPVDRAGHLREGVQQSVLYCSGLSASTLARSSGFWLDTHEGSVGPTFVLSGMRRYARLFDSGDFPDTSLESSYTSYLLRYNL
jgi:hypothetical protein